MFSGFYSLRQSQHGHVRMVNSRLTANHTYSGIFVWTFSYSLSLHIRAVEALVRLYTCVCVSERSLIAYMIRTDPAYHTCFTYWLSGRVLNLRSRNPWVEPCAVIVLCSWARPFPLLLSTGKHLGKHHDITEFCFLGRKILAETYIAAFWTNSFSMIVYARWLKKSVNQVCQAIHVIF